MTKHPPVVAVDLDGVVFNTLHGSVAAFNDEHGANFAVSDIFNFDAEHDKSLFVVNDTDYFYKHQLNHPTHTLVSGVVEALSELKRSGIRVVALTARSEAMFSEATEVPIANYFGVGSGPDDLFYAVYYSKPNGSADRRDKGEIAKELGVSVLVDDAVRHCKSAVEHGVGAVLLLDSYNRQGHDWPERFSAASWSDAVVLIKQMVSKKDGA